MRWWPLFIYLNFLIEYYHNCVWNKCFQFCFPLSLIEHQLNMKSNNIGIVRFGVTYFLFQTISPLTNTFMVFKCIKNDLISLICFFFLCKVRRLVTRSTIFFLNKLKIVGVLLPITQYITSTQRWNSLNVFFFLYLINWSTIEIVGLFVLSICDDWKNESVGV